MNLVQEARLMDEAKLIHKLKLLEAIYADTDKEGERIAAGLARDRILERLKSLRREDPAIEFQFSIPDPWKRKLLLALLRRYDISPYRYYRQRRTTVMARAPQSFINETLWPEYEQFARTLEEYLAGVTDRVLRTVLEQETADADTVDDRELLLQA